jgi:ABC-type spermidine/putrescine transport system permease subunit I
MEDKLDLDFIWTKILIALTFLVSLVFSLLIRLKKRKKYKEVKAFKNYLEEAKLKDDIYLPYYISYGIIDFK